MTILDAWKEGALAPFNQFGDSYTFLVSRPWLWRASYLASQPAWFHTPYLHACAAFFREGLSQIFDNLQPDLVVRSCQTPQRGHRWLLR